MAKPQVFLAVKITLPEGAFDPQKIIGQEGVVSFSKEAEAAGEDATHWKWTTPSGKKREVTSATLKIEGVQGDVWRGSIGFQLAPGGESQATSDSGSFEARVTVEAAKAK